MPWYKSGLVSVVLNSNAVIGTGTAFIANSRVGDAFRGPDGGWYEVTNIASDTAMSISPNYQGPTNASGTYALAPMQGYVKDSADALRVFVNTYGPKLAALGTTGNYDVLPMNKGGTGITDMSAFIQGLLNDADGPAARLTLGAAKSGSNNDITALSGMTTALSISQGGTGNNTGTATKLASAAILGSVAQSGGVPTGSIIERGSNVSGEYVKFADGTLIAFLNPVGNPSISANALAAFGPYATPVNFTSNIFFVSAVAVPNASNDTYGVITSYSLSNNTVGFVFRNGATAQTFGNIKILCVGRWF